MLAYLRSGFRKPRRLIVAFVAAAAACVAGSLSAAPPTLAQRAVTITGAGSTFDYPLFSKMFSVYHGLHPNVQVNYQSIGSGGGQQQLFAGTVNFGASDAPLTDGQLKQHPGIVHIPITLGAVSVGYNLPGVPTGLRLTGDVIARIYLGQITSWSDPAITRLNPSMKVPNLPIAVVHRSDGSGTSFIFTSYLSAISPEWQSKVGAAAAVDWPTGVGAKGSEGVSGQVKQTPGGIGYFEMAYSIENKIPMATLQNAAGRWVGPSVPGASAGAAQAAAHMPADLRSVWVNAPGPQSYPIAGFSWILVDNAHVSQPLIDLLTWMIHDGQKFATALYYAPLPPQVVQLDEQKIKALSPR
jgi:phosphate transport system substrate-binding protein